MRHKHKINLNKCRIIFFDLEFYVPEKSRAEYGFCYNPWDKTCKFLGGSFLLANPEKDFETSEAMISKKTQSLWLWDHGSEKELLESIYKVLKSTVDIVRNANSGMISPIFCGIGIGSSDVPVLFELFKRYQILTNAEAFSFQNNFRVIDLSLLSVATFNNNNYFLYPKTKNEIFNKYINGKKFESGKAVWQLFEAKNYNEIAERVLDEIICTHQCYGLIKSDLNKFKSLETYEKMRKKFAIRDERRLSQEISE